jgi:hypothetical protein
MGFSGSQSSMDLLGMRAAHGSTAPALRLQGFHGGFVGFWNIGVPRPALGGKPARFPRSDAKYALRVATSRHQGVR